MSDINMPLAPGTRRTLRDRYAGMSPHQAAIAVLRDLNLPITPRLVRPLAQAIAAIHDATREAPKPSHWTLPYQDGP
jgi:hypothetical protein